MFVVQNKALPVGLISHHPGMDAMVLDEPGSWEGYFNLGLPAPEILVVHALIGYDYPPEMCFRTVKPTLVVSGDLHAGIPMQRVEDSWYCNPGALARVSIADYDRIPQVAIIDMEPGSGHVDRIEYVPVPCKPAASVFDLAAHVSAKEDTQQHSEMVRMLAEGSADPMTPVDDALEGMGLAPEVKEYVEGKLQQAEEDEK
jgi:hypothetical protein